MTFLPVRSRVKTRVTDDEADTEYSCGSMETSTESSMHGDEMTSEFTQLDPFILHDISSGHCLTSF